MVHDWLNQPGYLALFSLSLLASTLLPLGSEWLLVMMLANGFDPLATVGVATAGNYLGGLTNWVIGRYGGRWLIERLLRVSPEQEQRAHDHYRRFGVYSLFFSWLPVVGDPLCLVSGILGTGFWQFTLLVASGKLARYAVTAWITLTAAS